MTKTKLTLFTTAVLIGLVAHVEVDVARRAQAQESFPRSYATSDIAPGVPPITSALSCDADTTTVVFQFDAIASVSAANALPIPDRSTGVISNLGASGFATCCLVDDVAATVGAQAAASTMLQVGGADGGSCYVVPAGQTVPFHENHLGRQLGLSYYTGACAAPSAHDRAVDYDMYLSCANNADCDNIGGTAASTTCEASATTLNERTSASAAKRIRGSFMVCRCSAASTLALRVER